MKFRGQPLKGPRTEIVPVVRSEAEGGPLFFTVRGITDFSEMEQILPHPKPPIIQLPGGINKPDLEDEGYRAEATLYSEKRGAWTVINAIKPLPEGLEWERVKYNDPSTWQEWEKELREAGFVEAELNRLLTAVMNLNGLNEALVEEARKSFLTSRVKEANGRASHQEDQSTTQSGKPA